MARKQKTISILGSTGSIGIQTLKVLESIPEHFRIGYLTTNTNIDLLAKQVKIFNPVGVVIKDKYAFEKFKSEVDFNGKIFHGKKGLNQASGDSINDMVLSALVGFSGVEPTMEAIKSGTTIALANKETLVSAGSVITKAARKNKVDIIAVDSEHSAILQCLIGESIEEVEKIILTASGGPFLNTPIDELTGITAKEALQHPNWSMGNKITIDSATMMNKGFEVIEAYWLFGLSKDKIDILIHPQSIVHSMVQFTDGSIKAQMGLPDMRIPISYALSYPRRLKFDFPRLDLSQLNELTFIKPDYQKFPCLKIAFQALETGGSAPAIINASNEIAVYAFLDNKIKFTDIPRCIEAALSEIKILDKPDLTDIIETDKDVRKFVRRFIDNLI
ncbi:MAG: 1-deoxy-D-xylulose-5-phosphate reductoisomerase [bacterium]